MNIILIGYRGTGKTTIARIIARKTGFELQNLDAMIVKAAGMNIPEIVAQKGWDQFRDLESQVLQQVADGDDQILDCGGGIILRPENRERLRQAGPVFWLTASVPVIVERIREDDQRPALTDKSFLEEIQEVLQTRTPLYQECAHHRINTDHQSPEQAAEQILELIGFKDD